jgi:predicted nuclease of restriction endonuclease-like (RecB) superfamily
MPHKKSKRSKRTTFVKKRSAAAGYDAILSDISGLLESARRASARTVNAIIAATYWEIGRRIVNVEQAGSRRKADYYGEQIIERLAKDLSTRFGRGFARRNLFQMRAFYLAYPNIVQTSSALSPNASNSFPLPWSHYVRLLSINDLDAREFYETEALRGGWSVRQLARQIDSMFYQRTALSRNKAAMLTKGVKTKPEDRVTPEEEIKDPYILEFLALKDEYSESQLEEALIRHLESFLLELGGAFTFVGRQKRLRIGDHWFRVDLLFFHRRLRCLVIIDLKLGEFTHADAGQMHMYLNYAREHWTNPDENPPVGLILCDEENAAVAHYTLENLPNKVLAAKYHTLLPDQKVLTEEIERTRRLIEAHRPAKSARKKPAAKK